MDSEIAKTTNNLTYEEARKKLKEVETLLKHRKPLEPDPKIGIETVMGSCSFVSGMIGVLGIPFGTVLSTSNPLFLLFMLPALSWIPFAGIGYNGNPKKKIRKFLYELFVPRKQKAIQEKQFEVIREYELQEKIFKLFVEQKKQELTSLGVFDVLNQGLPESYPQMDSYGEVRELSPHQWRTLQSDNSDANKESLADKLNMEENLRYLISENPQALKEIKA